MLCLVYITFLLFLENETFLTKAQMEVGDVKVQNVTCKFDLLKFLKEYLKNLLFIE